MNTNQQILLNIDAKVQSANAATSLRELKQLTRELQSEALKYQGVNEEAFQAAQRAAAGMADKIDDVREAISAAKGEPLEQLNSGFSLLRQSIFDLDFDKANLGLNTMATSIKSINPSKLKEGFAGLTSSLSNLGKSLLTNPIFLLGTAIVLIITNFEKLIKVGGVVGDLFKGIGAFVSTLTKSIILLTDAIGLTDSKMQNLMDTTNALQTANSDLTAGLRQVEIARKEALGESTVAERYYQIYVDGINKASDSLIAFAKGLELSGAELEKLRALSEDFIVEVKDNLGNTLAYEIPESMKDFVKALNIGGDKVKELLDKYIEYRKSVMVANSFLMTEQDKQEKASMDRLQRDAEERNKIVTNQRSRNLQDLKLSNEKENIEQSRNQKKMLRELYELRNSTNEYYDGAIARQQKLAEQGIISNEQLLENTKQFNIQRFQSLQQTDSEIGKLVTNRSNATKSNLVEVLGLEKKTDGEKKKIVEAEFKRLEDQGVKIGEADEREKNRRIKYLQDRNKVNLRADIDLLNSKQTNLDEESDIVMKSLDFQYFYTDQTYKEIYSLENKKAKEVKELKVALAIDSYEIEKQRLDKEIELYADDEAKVAILKNRKAYLESQHKLKLAQINRDYTTTTKALDEDLLKSMEKVLKEEERIALERIQIKQNLLDAQKNQFQEQADMDASELQRLSLGTEKFKLNTQEKLDIVNDMYINQSAALKTSMEMELNQVDLSEERKQQIREIYAEKQKLLAAQTADAKLQIEQEATQKQIANMQYLADSFNGIADFMTVMDDMRRDESGKLDEASQRRAFFRNKALQTGSAIMNTAAGITNALSTQNYPGAIAIGIAGAAQIAKILATRFEPENGGGGSGGTSTTGGGGSITPPTPASAPSAPLMGQGYLNQQFNPMTFGGAVGFRPGGEQRVFVLEQDITAMQNRVRVMTGRSTLSGTV